MESVIYMNWIADGNYDERTIVSLEETLYLSRKIHNF